jgi:hypothetical protein
VSELPAGGGFDVVGENGSSIHQMRGSLGDSSAGWASARLDQWLLRSSAMRASAPAISRASRTRSKSLASGKPPNFGINDSSARLMRSSCASVTTRGAVAPLTNGADDQIGVPQFLFDSQERGEAGRAVGRQPRLVSRRRSRLLSKSDLSAKPSRDHSCIDADDAGADRIVLAEL